MMTAFRQGFQRFFHDTGGATAVEYGIIVAAITVAISAAILLFGSSLEGHLAFLSGLISGG